MGIARAAVQAQTHAAVDRVQVVIAAAAVALRMTVATDDRQDEVAPHHREAAPARLPTAAGVHTRLSVNNVVLVQSILSMCIMYHPHASCKL